MHAPRAVLPPAVARIFERADRLEPLFAHRAHKGQRLGPLPQAPSFPEPIDLESRPPRQRGRSWDFRGDQSPELQPSPRDEELEATGHELFSNSYPHPSFQPQPPPGRSPRSQKAARSARLAQMVYSAPVVPGLPVWPRKRRPQSLPRHRDRSADARPREANKEAATAHPGGLTARKPAPPRERRPPRTQREKEEQAKMHMALTKETVSSVLNSAFASFVSESRSEEDDSDYCSECEVVELV